MHRLTPEIKENINRWIEYGWEWHIIHKLLFRFYGIDLPKEKIELMIEDQKKYGEFQSD